MAAAIPFVAQAGSSVMGGIQENKAKHSQEKQWGVTRKIWTDLDPAIQEIYSKALGSIDSGYTAAQNNITGVGHNAKMGAAATVKQGVGAQTDSAIGRGLYGTSAIQGIQNAGASTLTKANAGIDEQTAMMLSNLMQQKAGAQAGIYGAQANNLLGQAQGESNALTSFNFTAGKSPSSSDIAGLGTSIFGGGAGSGVPGLFGGK
jgi:hypothetical protein